MKHSILDKQRLDGHNSLIQVKLIAETDSEAIAINNFGSGQTSDAEKELIENYLHFSLALGNYSIVELINQDKNVFSIKIFI